ncbi:hypothetical protein PV433_27115 [Paenibacillus sp. GYB004]|uniref:hypothetical protein n=1 Tax=Paenibacillus sp. GYB004 TaxID=2994393 RepID=UPI002F96AEEC
MDELERYKLAAEQKIKSLESASDIQKIERFSSLHLKGVQISRYQSSSYYDSNIYVRIDVDRMTQELIEKDSTIVKGMNRAHYGSYWTIPIKESREADDKATFEHFLSRLTEFDQPTHEENLRKKATNTKTEQSLMSLLYRIGLQTKFTGYSSKRSTRQTEQAYNYPSEIRGQIPTHYDENAIESQKNLLLKQFGDIYNKELSKVREERQKKEREEADRLANKKLALLLAKYDLSLESEWSDVLDAIIERNKYLRLGHYLDRNRADWNDGDWYARRGLDGFEIETEIDQKIYNNISQHCGEGWGFDGRIFRDCKFNYDVLFAMAAEQDAGLYSDYETVREMVGD